MFTTPSVTPEGALDAALGRPRSSRKRKQTDYQDDGSFKVANSSDQRLRRKAKTSKITNSSYASIPGFPPGERESRSKAKTSPNEEKRLRRFRPRAPQSYLEIKERALTQRLTVLDRERCGTDEVPEEKVTMAGSTGNVYTQRICTVPSCDCPHAKKGNQCKHIIYVMLRVLKAPENIGYQLALTSQELRDLFQNAAPIPSADPSGKAAASAEDGKRRLIEGECPICYMDFEPSKEAITYCKAGCGNNVHEGCMQSWMSAKAGKATCPYCRAQWASEELASFKGKVSLDGAPRTEEGYVNVANQLGLSGERDYSTYHPYWVRQRYGYGGGRGRW